MAARVADERVTGDTKIVVVAKHIEIPDIFELAGTISRFARESPIATGEIGRAGRKPDDGGGNVIAGSQIVDKKVCGRPRLGKIRDAGDDGIVAVRVRQQGIGVGRRRRNLELRSGLNTSGMYGPIVGKPTDGKQKHEPERDDTNDQRQKRIRPADSRSRGAHAGDLRHVGFKTRC